MGASAPKVSAWLGDIREFFPQTVVQVMQKDAVRGGTNIDRALAYCQSQISRPTDTTLVLVTDLYEGGDERSMRKRMVDLVNSRV